MNLDKTWRDTKIVLLFLLKYLMIGFCGLFMAMAYGFMFLGIWSDDLSEWSNERLILLRKNKQRQITRYQL